jgi:hypothetical protein
MAFAENSPWTGFDMEENAQGKFTPKPNGDYRIRCDFHTAVGRPFRTGAVMLTTWVSRRPQAHIVQHGADGECRDDSLDSIRYLPRNENHHLKENLDPAE